MAENFGQSSTQGAILYSFGQQAAGTTVTLADASGNVLAEYTPSKSFSSIVISTPEIQTGETYTLTVGGQSYTIEMTSLIYGEGMMMGMGQMGGMGQQGDMSDMGQMPGQGGSPQGGFPGQGSGQMPQGGPMGQ